MKICNHVHKKQRNFTFNGVVCIVDGSQKIKGN